jgi:hypothetical protein
MAKADNGNARNRNRFSLATGLTASVSGDVISPSKGIGVF